jgi:hypothetical protein
VKRVSDTQKLLKERAYKVAAGLFVMIAHGGGYIQEYHEIHGIILNLSGQRKNKNEHKNEDYQGFSHVFLLTNYYSIPLRAAEIEPAKLTTLECQLLLDDVINIY